MIPKNCPMDTSLKYIGKKWTLNILRDLYVGRNKFSEFLKENKKLTSKVLAQRLKELERYGLIEKKVISQTPIEIKYFLTKKGKNINKVIYELAVFSVNNIEETFPYSNVTKEDKENTIEILKETFIKN